ncbi:MAG: hypothetical protein A2Y07_10755 [Planctomycetes bacterium GWF2_50_10]|nr:MAG: hypothetical protein A2Y07_10755 [Planctomycetes bacterium GWF2_50_10]
MKILLIVLTISIFIVASGCHKPAAPAPAPQTLTINVQNPNGSYVPVTLIKVGGEFVGPKGERYISQPTAEQLAPLYGVK